MNSSQHLRATRELQHDKPLEATLTPLLPSLGELQLPAINEDENFQSAAEGG